jgi:SAM-dependent methyltransferase
MQFHDMLYNLLLLLAIILLGFIVYKSFQKNQDFQEGFEQSDAFILKINESIYDEFYVEVYDELMQSKKRTKEQTDLIIKTVPIDKEKSRILDIGSGTGSTVSYVTHLGYRIEGIDKSDEMVKKSKELYNTIHIKNGDVTIPMEYEHGIFTHILCSHFTIYEMEDKMSFFKNCYFWLKGRGLLIIHLVDRSKFSPIIPSANNGSILETSDQRITKTVIDYNGYNYSSNYEFNNDSVFHKETFVDKKTKHIRQNEQTLYMENHKDILKMAIKVGFTIKDNIPLDKSSSFMNDQWLFILERTL